MDGLIRVSKYVGEANVPGDIKRLRRSVYETMRRFGSPVIVKHMLTEEDVESGFAAPSPIFQDPYGQVRNNDPFSYGIGYVSVEASEDEWIAPDGTIIVSETNPGSGYVPAPRYRGFGPGYLTYIIEPDQKQDFFKLTKQGVLFRVQDATAQAPWWPDVNDNDLLINVMLDGQGNVVETQERYQAKMTNPVTMRGRDKRGHREFTGQDGGNRFTINQSFEMTLVPTANILMQVETDR